MSEPKIAGLVLVAGSLFFIVAASLPPTAVFAESVPIKKLTIILNAQGTWAVMQFLFALGSLVAALGIGLVAYHFRNIQGSALAYLAFTAFVIGAALWSWHAYSRAADPNAFVEGTLPAWPFVVYTLLTLAGLLLFGLLLLRTGLPNWAGWVLIIGASLFFVLYLIFKDLPPGLHYLLTLFLGIMMYWRG